MGLEMESPSGGSLNLSLLDNAYDSLNESLAKVALTDEAPSQWKFAVLNLVHALELFLKQRLHAEHRLLLFENVDRPTRTVSLERALERLRSIDVTFSAGDIAAIQQAIKWRNSITHYETNLRIGDVRINYLLIFEFLDAFHQSHFGEGLTLHVTPANTSIAARMIQDFRNEFIEFQGREMHREWPHQLFLAQKYPEFIIGGVAYRRIVWGRETPPHDPSIEVYPYTEYCHDCGCQLGQFHGPDCDSEECPRCGHQFLSCECSLVATLWDGVSVADD